MIDAASGVSLDASRKVSFHFVVAHKQCVTVCVGGGGGGKTHCYDACKEWERQQRSCLSTEGWDDVRRQPLSLERTAKFIWWEIAASYITVFVSDVCDVSACDRNESLSSSEKNKWQSSVKAIFHNGKIMTHCAKKAQMGNKGDERNFLGKLLVFVHHLSFWRW